MLAIAGGFVLRLRVRFLVLYTYFLMQLPVRSRRIIVITVKVPAGSARYGRQCRSSGPSLTLALGRWVLTIHMLNWGWIHLYLLLSIVEMWKQRMSRHFWKLISCHQYLCDGMYCRHLLWQIFGGKYTYVLPARWPTTVPSVWSYFLPLAKCVHVHCWQALTLL